MYNFINAVNVYRPCEHKVSLSNAYYISTVNLRSVADKVQSLRANLQ